MMYLGIDYGTKRIGLALGRVIPKGAGVIENKNSMKVIDQIKKICDEFEVQEIIIGLPTLPSGTEGMLAPEVREFAEKLKEQLKIEVNLEPEGFTSVAAEELFKQNSKKREDTKGKLDEVAAILILEQYLNKINKGKTLSEIADGE